MMNRFCLVLFFFRLNHSLIFMAASNSFIIRLTYLSIPYGKFYVFDLVIIILRLCVGSYLSCLLFAYFIYLLNPKNFVTKSFVMKFLQETLKNVLSFHQLFSSLLSSHSCIGIFIHYMVSF